MHLAQKQLIKFIIKCMLRLPVIVVYAEIKSYAHFSDK